MKFALAILLVPFVSGVLFSNRAGAAAPKDAPPPEAVPAEQQVPPKSPGDAHAKFLESRLEALRRSLKLNADQQDAWNQWSAKIKEARTDWKEKHEPFESLSKLPVPERLEKMVAFAKERLARLEENLAATKAFYAVLTPAQRQTFDKDFNFWPHGGRPGKRGGTSLVRPPLKSR